ncbi:hypothetical protein NGRA_3099 [Nosema granulosis]|uniref:Uncharacterized protein n=1 Tax=Nosema granulosis TaxID=83296 RepID=A0A9P6KXJ2_9MICR|nr:hypothetical protein NGRA_3099 [Nosema granulosis]
MTVLRNYIFLVMIESAIVTFRLQKIFAIEDPLQRTIVKNFQLVLFTLMNTNFGAMCGLIIKQEYYCIYLIILLKINELVIRVQVIYYWQYQPILDTLYIIVEGLFYVTFYRKWHIIYPIILANFNERVGSNRTVFKAYTVRNFFKACRFNSYLISTYVLIILFCSNIRTFFYDYILLGKVFLYTIEYYICENEEDEDCRNKKISIAFWVLFAGHTITTTTIYLTQDFTNNPDKLPYGMYSIFNLLTLISNIADYRMYGKGCKEALKKAKADKKSRPFYKKYRAI